MKQLMLGNKAVARGLYEAGCCVASSYPGTPSTEITEEAAKFDDIYCEWAPNEKVAMEVAFGAAMAGKRSFCAMKHVGLNVAADPLFTASYIGVNARHGASPWPTTPACTPPRTSRIPAIMPSPPRLPMLEPARFRRSAVTFTKLAYELSEQFDTPVILRLSTRIAHSQLHCGDTVSGRSCRSRNIRRTLAKYVMMPAFAKPKHVDGGRAHPHPRPPTPRPPP